MKIFSFFILLAMTFTVEACTGLKLVAKNGQAVHGRTFEFGLDVPTSVAFVPRGYAFTGETPNGKGLDYQTKYASLGTICYDNIAIMDGMNEKGLSVGTFYFPGYAKYGIVNEENQSRALSPIDFPNWILTQFATLDEVKKALPNILIAPTIIATWGNTPPPFHYIVYDKEGNSLVIEPVDGKLQVSDNPLGVFTNSPDFNWHMTNLQNFAHLSAQNASSIKIEGINISPFGQGSGMLGLPGDFTPPSRFVRAAVFSATAIPSATTEQAISQAFHLLNQFDIPLGTVRQGTYADYTLATTVHDPSNLKYFFKTYHDQAIRVVDLNAFDLNGTKIQIAPMSGQESYIDVSKELKYN